MGRKSKDKGARGERELAGELHRLFGISTRRGVQHRGGSDSPDVITDFDNIHFEVKRTERLSLYPAMKQAIDDAGEGIPVVCHRQNNKEWLAVVRLDDLPKLAVELVKRDGAQLETELDSTADDYPFQEDWERRQAEPLPEFTNPKGRLPISFHEIPPLNTKEPQ